MGKRLIRIFRADLLRQLPGLLDTELNMILKNGVTLHGRISGFDPSSLVLEDVLQRKHTIRLADVEEIVLDQVNPY
jgi:small nuclear ribonucleoprotein (snRNP)-like protein